ncbi:MAG: alpha/beta fold hydrolase [Aquabacterium sp.]|jgi:pimeloyl-ACP methyl ester carboxylesterase|uniref:esterase/lipase family protein n=1 Tax=Aquabacterium sp. TaxID=1872578 RepID=UPI003BAF16A2
MHALFVHGMGRSTWSGWPMLRQLTKAGLRTSSHGYNVSLQRFDVIRDGLVQRIHGLAGQELVLIGHSLGGVLIRAALAAMPPDASRPKHIFLLGSPVQPSCLAQRLQPNPVFRLVTRDCGHLLSSAERMGGIAIPPGPLTSIVGVKGLTGRLSPFGAEPNDGVVSLSEVSSVNIPDQVRLPIVHTLLPSSTEVAKVILQRIGLLAGR